MPAEIGFIIGLVDKIPVVFRFDSIIPFPGKTAYRVGKGPEIAKGLPLYDFKECRVWDVSDDPYRLNFVGITCRSPG
jgi:hypothetical protein